MRLAPLAGLLLASLAAGCGHVPLASLPKLSKIDIRTTELSQLLRPSKGIRSLPT